MLRCVTVIKQNLSVGITEAWYGILRIMKSRSFVLSLKAQFELGFNQKNTRIEKLGHSTKPHMGHYTTSPSWAALDMSVLESVFFGLRFSRISILLGIYYSCPPSRPLIVRPFYSQGLHQMSKESSGNLQNPTLCIHLLVFWNRWILHD